MTDHPPAEHGSIEHFRKHMDGIVAEHYRRQRKIEWTARIMAAIVVLGGLIALFGWPR